MSVKIAINGFGRIGRMLARIVLGEKGVELVAINDLVDAPTLAYLLKYDSTHGIYPLSIEAKEDTLVVGGKKISVYSEKDPGKLPWKEKNVDIVIECSGHFTTYEGAKAHLDAGAKKVVISAPAKGDIPYFVMGVNHLKYNPFKHHIVSNASCTTNCLAPLVHVLLHHFGIEEGLMTTVHATTATQPTVDAPSKKDLRGGRSAFANIIPSSTGAAEAVGKCIPEIKGKLTGMAFRVPVTDVSVVDLTVKLTKSTEYDTICGVMRHAANHELKGILGYTEDPVVSSDFLGSSYSTIFDKHAGIALNDRFFKLIAWYDNEIGYAHRLKDLVALIASKL